MIEGFGGEIFMTLMEVRYLIERWRRWYNRRKFYSLLGYKPPATEV
ncbi:MAG TPA: hypothetical protein DDZ34_02300 [Syntrophaceae bacterium]|nr:hypothetical protein [Syntrophaceae bacterium]